MAEKWFDVRYVKPDGSYCDGDVAGWPESKAKELEAEGKVVLLGSYDAPKASVAKEEPASAAELEKQLASRDATIASLEEQLKTLAAQVAKLQKPKPKMTAVKAKKE